MHRPLALCCALVFLALPVFAEPPPPPQRLSSHFRKVARLEAPIPEISGMTQVATDAEGERHFLAVSDEGAYDPEQGAIVGSLFRLRLAYEGEHVDVAGVEEVKIDVGEAIPRMDPLWPAVGGHPDLESCVPLPGSGDLYLLGGERNPQDASDGGANRLYVVRYPAGDPGRASLLSYLRLPDLPDDTINDRLEAVVAVPLEGQDGWMLCAMKERTYSPDRVPVYFPALLIRSEDPRHAAGLAFEPARPRALIQDPRRFASQADACLAPDGKVWVLDRWRREVHLATPITKNTIGLRYEKSFDYFDLVKGIPGEAAEGAVRNEQPAPSGRHKGYGRQEGICFDERGWLYLAADLGGGNPSVVTVLAPR